MLARAVGVTVADTVISAGLFVSAVLRIYGGTSVAGFFGGTDGIERSDTGGFCVDRTPLVTVALVTAFGKVRIDPVEVEFDVPVGFKPGKVDETGAIVVEMSDVD